MINFVVYWILFIIFTAVDALLAMWFVGSVFPHLHLSYGQWWIIVASLVGVTQTGHALNRIGD